jgi:hypothetical protein
MFGVVCAGCIIAPVDVLMLETLSSYQRPNSVRFCYVYIPPYYKRFLLPK